MSLIQLRLASGESDLMNQEKTNGPPVPIFKQPSHSHDEMRSIVWHRDFPGMPVAVFEGQFHSEMADWFCETCGQPSGFKTKAK